MKQSELQSELVALASKMPREELVCALTGVIGAILLVDCDRREVADYFRQVGDVIERNGAPVH